MSARQQVGLNRDSPTRGLSALMPSASEDWRKPATVRAIDPKSLPSGPIHFRRTRLLANAIPSTTDVANARVVAAKSGGAAGKLNVSRYRRNPWPHVLHLPPTPACRFPTT